MLGLNELPNDWYAVYKSVTKYAESRIEDIAKFIGKLTSHRGYKDINKLYRLMSMEEFHRFKKCNFPNLRKSDDDKNSYHPAVKRNKKCYGIPQGRLLVRSLQMCICWILIRKYVITFEHVTDFI